MSTKDIQAKTRASQSKDKETNQKTEVPLKKSTSAPKVLNKDKYHKNSDFLD